MNKMFKLWKGNGKRKGESRAEEWEKKGGKGRKKGRGGKERDSLG